MNNQNSNSNGNCINEILCVILVLQENACPDNCLQTCDRPVLGGGTNCIVCNTRPVMLYTCCGNGVPWSMPITKDSTVSCAGSDVSATCSNVFRVEKIEGVLMLVLLARMSLEWKRLKVIVLHLEF